MSENREVSVLLEAEELADAGDYAAAERLCDAVLAEVPDSAAALNLKGYCLASSGRVAEALPCFRLARLYVPDYAPIRYNLARALEDTGDAAAAAAEYDEVLRLDPGQAAARASRAVLRAAAGDADGAAEDFGEWIRREPADARAYLLRGGWHLTSGRAAEALPDLRKALELDPALKEHVEALVAAVAGAAN